jgi:zinc transport system ATP-binding protein
MIAPLVQLRNVCVTLGGNPILRGVDADLARGQITALIGLNGSGKTTLLRCLLKEIPYTGTIEFKCGHDHRHALPEQVGYVPQRLRFDAQMPLTVADLLALAMRRRPIFLGIGRRTKRKMADMLEQVKSPEALLRRPFEKLSGGEQQRVLLALALEPSPELLLLDEPAAGVDFKDQETFYDLISRINRDKNTTIVLVSHDISMVPHHAHHVLCLKNGRIECQGPPASIITPEVLSRIFGKEMGIFHHHHDHT